MTMASIQPPSSKDRRKGKTPHTVTSKYATIIQALLVFSERIRPLTASSASSFPTSKTTLSTPESPPSPSAGPFDADTISNFLKNRCGGSNADDFNGTPAMWSYEGTLTDPMTGKVIAEVEGLELVKPLPTIKPSQLSVSDYRNNDQSSQFMEHLSAKDLLCRNHNPISSSVPSWDAATTMLSRRLFCYRRPSSSSNRNTNDVTSNSNKDNDRFSPYKSLLISLRLRPDGPLRHLSPLENIAVYDSAITYISRNKGREMVVFSERGGRGGVSETGDGSGGGRNSVMRQHIMGSAQTNAPGEGHHPAVFDFAVRAQRGMVDAKSDDTGGPVLPPLQISSSDQIGSEDVIISPPRSSFFQFGKGDSSGSSLERKYGTVRETYTYSFDHNMEEDGGLSSPSEANQNKFDFVGRIKDQIGRKTAREAQLQSQPRCSVRYTRYGEAPPWYAPGRSCTLELRGKRIALPPPTDAPDGKGDVSNTLELSQHLPPLASWAASKCNFWSGWPAVFSNNDRNAESTDLMRQYYQLPLKSETELARQAVESFRNEEQLSIGPLDDYPAAERNQWLLSAENAISKTNLCFRRISKSFIVSELPREKNI